MAAFKVGSDLRLQVSKPEGIIEAKVMKLLQPWTLSAVMAIRIISQPEGLQIPSPVILKLYDRRFSTEAREEWKAAEWKPETEKPLLELSRSGEARKLMDDLEDDPDLLYDKDPWAVAEREVAITTDMERFAKAEVETYEIFKEHQGSLIPQFYTAVTLSTVVGEDLGLSPELFDFSGILIEYIDGFCMTDLALHVPESQWPSMVDRAGEVVSTVINTGSVVNTDVRPENALVCRDDKYDGGWRFVMIDFAMCKTREDETDDEWGSRKDRQDEENALSAKMWIKLRYIGYDLEWKRRDTWGKYGTEVWLRSVGKWYS
ncbi:hypothetical protein CC79DRAFT_1132939 [Sarocladium strictum]